MNVIIGNQEVRLDKKSVIGSGGEAIVHRFGQMAVKIYHDPTSSRAKKLKDFLALNLKLPDNVIYPQDLVYDKGRVKTIGFTMRRLESGYEVVAQLAKRGFRATFDITTHQVVDLFVNAHTTLLTIHNNGLVAGDLNDLNELFHGNEISFIDVDSFQFGPYPCMVGTETYLDPSLYGVDLSKRPVFRPENDWYSFAVLLFRSLLLVHPFGGVHPKVKLLTQRAQQGVMVFDKEVIYPKIGLSPDLLTDDLAEIFYRIFVKSWRGIFPIQEIEKYRDALVQCPSCQAWHPHQRANCPECSVKNIIIMRMREVIKGCQYEDIIIVQGKIIFFRIIGSTLYCLADEGGLTVLYTKKKDKAVSRIELFKSMPGARYDMVDNYLVVCSQPTASEILVIDISGKRPKGILKTTTEIFAGARAVFGCSDQYFYRIAGGMLMRGEIKNDELIERTITSIMPNQTWFTVSSDDLIFGFFRVFQKLEWLLINFNSRQKIAIPELKKGERLVDLSVKFSKNSLLLIRKTRQKGMDYIRVEIIDKTGNISASHRFKQADVETYTNVYGQAYAYGITLHPTDKGIVKEKVAERSQTTFAATEAYVNEEDTLYQYDRSILVVKEDRVIKLTLV